MGARHGWADRLRPHRRVLAAAAVVLLLAGLLVPFSVRVYALADRRAAGPAWRFPSRVYSDAVVLTAGRVLPPAYLLAELDARGYTREAAVAEPGTYAATPAGFDIHLRGFRDAQDPAGTGGPEIVRLALDDSTLLRVDRDPVARGAGAAAAAPDLAHAPRLEPALVSILVGSEGVRRSYVTLDRIPRAVQDAVIAAEDRRFYSHLGIDPWSDMRALVANLRANGIREGGSTITQQLARGLFLGGRRSWTRKLAELPLAMGLELLLGKHRILEMYLNMVYWGQADGGGIGGIAEASRWYFDVPVEALRTDQAAMLAGIIRAPNTIDPFDHPQAALRMRNQVLSDLVATHRLDPGEARRLAQLPLGLHRGPPPIELHPSYTGYVRQLLSRRFGLYATESWGLEIFTTMDLAFQIEAERGLPAGLERLDPARPRGVRLEGAFVALEPGTEAVRAVVGGRNPDAGDYNRATQARRQTGSAIKPIVYAAALSEAHVSFTPASTVPNELRSFGAGRYAWTPRNDDDHYTKTVTLANALARSLNVATANLVQIIHPTTVAYMAERFGLGRLKPVMSIGLGTNEVSLLELTDAFAVFDGGGIRHGASPIRVVIDNRGRTILDPDRTADQVLPPEIAAVMTGLLENVVNYGVARPLRTRYGFDRPVAGKTGTTNNFHDAWFVGFTPQLVAGVWLGFDRPRSLGRYAAYTALPVWASIVGGLIGAFPKTPFASDVGLEHRAIDPWTGMLADSSSCPSMMVPFLPGTGPIISCGTAPGFFPDASDSPYMPDSVGGIVRPLPDDSTYDAVPDTTQD